MVGRMALVRDELRVDLDVLLPVVAVPLEFIDELADDLLHAGVDVGAVEGGEALVHQHVEGPEGSPGCPDGPGGSAPQRAASSR